MCTEKYLYNNHIQYLSTTLVVVFFLQVIYAFRISSGKTGMAPFCVQTKALAWTAMRCASGIGLPLRYWATKVAVNESPAPTVSATLTLGVSTHEVSSAVKT